MTKTFRQCLLHSLCNPLFFALSSALLFSTFSVPTLAQTAPNITSVSPPVGPVSPVGGSVTIMGTGFGSQPGTVAFGGIQGSPTSWSDTQVIVPVPSTVPAGFANVVVTVNGTASNAQSFLVIPTITQNSSFQGTIGTPITITGSSFGAQQGSSTLTFNGITATPTLWSDTSITAPVPVGTSNGAIVATINGLATNGLYFYVTPAISGFTPATASVGATVTISGSGFGAAQGFGGVTFNGASATVQNWNDSSIVVTVPSGATTGPVVVTAANLLSSNSVNFTFLTPILSGQLAPTVTAVTLTSPLALDWEHWGTSADVPLVRMAGSAGLISDLRVIGTASPVIFDDGEVEYLWTDGDVLTTAERTTTGVSLTGSTNGFHLTVPADTVPQTLLLYVGVDNGQGQLTASLSDNSIAPFIDSSLNSGQNNHLNGTYAIDFRAIQPGQSLNIDYVLLVDQGDGTSIFGGVSLQSAALLPRLPTVSVTAPVDGQSFTYPATINAAIDASQIDLAINKVDLFIDSQNPLELTAAPYSFSLSGLTAGDHVLTATATDANSLLGSSSPVLISEIQGGGSLTASIDVPANIDISAGTTDWVHWGNFDSTNNVDRKAGITPEISDLTTLANGDVLVADDASRGGISYSWSGGTPTDAQTGTTTQVFMQGYKNGFTLTIPADTTVRTAKVYFGYGFGTSQLRASLSDGSATPWVNVFSTTDFYDEKVVSFQFQAASAGQKLIVSDQVIADGGFAYVDLEATTVTDQSSPVINIVSPASGGPGTTLTISGSNFGDSPGTVTLSGSALTVNTWSKSSITATLAGGYASGPIVISQGLANSNGFPFTYLGPVITSLIPNAGPPGTLVTIGGQNLGQNPVTITFGGIQTNATSQGPAAIQTTVPTGISLGPTQVVVQTSAGNTNALQFDVVQAPVIASLTPSFGITGQMVKIFGTNFGLFPANSTINFGGFQAPAISWSESVIQTQVPAGFLGGIVTVTVGGQTSNGMPFEVPFRCLTDCNAQRSAIDISPQNLAVVVGDSVNLNVVDNLGETVPFPSFSLSDSSLGSVTPGDKISIFTAVAPGTETVTATVGSLAASTTVTIYAGPTLPDGTIKWQLPASIVGGSAANFVLAQPAANSATATFVEDQSDPFNNVIIRALDVNGMQLWAWPTLTSVHTLFFNPVAPTPTGGFVYTDGLSINAIDANGHPLWSYPYPQFQDQPLSVGYDGTVYALVDLQFGTNRGASHLVALDGQKGTEKFRIPMPQGHGTVTGTSNNVNCPSFCWPFLGNPPTQDSDGPDSGRVIVSRPIVLADGSVNVAAWTQKVTENFSPNSNKSSPPCTSQDQNPNDNCGNSSGVYCPVEVIECWVATVNEFDQTLENDITLVNVQPDGTYKQYQLSERQVTCDTFGFQYQYVQDDNESAGPGWVYVQGLFRASDGSVKTDGHLYRQIREFWTQGTCGVQPPGPNGLDIMVVPNGSGGVLVASETGDLGNPVWIKNVTNPGSSGDGAEISISSLNTLNRIVIGENGTAFAAGTWNFFETPRLISFNLSGGSANWTYDSQFGTSDSPGYVDIVAAGPNGSLYATEGDLFNQIPEVAFTLDATGNRTDNPTSSQPVTYVSSAGIGTNIWMGANVTITASLGGFDFGFGMPAFIQSGQLSLAGITAYESTGVFIAHNSNPMPSPSGAESLNAAIRDKIAHIAQSKLGSQNWLDQQGLNKCNIFVHDVIKEAGQIPPESPKSSASHRIAFYLGLVDSKNYPAQAGDWANPDLILRCWQPVQVAPPPPGFVGPPPLPFPAELSEPGDVIAEAINFRDATGHVGFVVGSRQTASADSAVNCYDPSHPPAGTITITDYGFRPDDYIDPTGCRKAGLESHAVVKRFVCQ